MVATFRAAFLVLLAFVGYDAWGQETSEVAPTSALEATVPAGDGSDIAARSPMPLPALSDAEEAQTKREAFIAEIKEHRDWYERQKGYYSTAWTIGTALVVILTGATSLMVAINFATTGRRRLILAILPAVAAMLVSLMAQFRIQELWELREAGRIEANALLARTRSIEAGTNAEMRRALGPLRADLVAIERAQAGLFFSYLSKNGPDDSPGRDPATPPPDGPPK